MEREISIDMYKHMCICMYTNIHTYIHTYIYYSHMCMCLQIYIERDMPASRRRAAAPSPPPSSVVSSRPVCVFYSYYH